MLDLLLAGRSNLLVPCVRGDDQIQTIRSPFSLAAGTEMVSLIADGLAFGIGLCLLLWALDYIELGTMPWTRIVADGLQLPTRETEHA